MGNVIARRWLKVSKAGVGFHNWRHSVGEDAWLLSVFNGSLPDYLCGIGGNYRPGGSALGYDRCGGQTGPFADLNAFQYDLFPILTSFVITSVQSFFP
jgi:hypothetical protein